MAIVVGPDKMKVLGNPYRIRSRDSHANGPGLPEIGAGRLCEVRHWPHGFTLSAQSSSYSLSHNDASINSGRQLTISMDPTQAEQDKAAPVEARLTRIHTGYLRNSSRSGAASPGLFFLSKDVHRVLRYLIRGSPRGTSNQCPFPCGRTVFR